MTTSDRRGAARPLRVAARNAEVAIESKPPWIKARLRTGPNAADIGRRVEAAGLHTVCREAACPNVGECWEDREATFLIGGDVCTRRCDFCQIRTGRPSAVDRDEPRRIADSVRELGLRYATVTGVARDDVDDGAAWLYAETVRQIHSRVPGCGVEILIPDFGGQSHLIHKVVEAKPEVLAHNVETVPRLMRRVRPAFRFERSLAVIEQAATAGLITKSNLILGMGEEGHEVTETMRALRSAGCHLLTITQYLRPSREHLPVRRWVTPEGFLALRDEAEALGFVAVMSGPLVRSSYRAGTLHARAIRAMDGAPQATSTGRGDPATPRG